MSETTEQTAEPAEEPVADATQAAAPETDSAPDQPEPEPPPKPKRTDRHIAQLTARISAMEADIAAERRRAEAAEALLNPGNEDDTPARDERGRFVPQPVDREAIRREIEFDAKRASLVEAGVKEFTREGWDEKTGILHNLGATRNSAFLEALVDLPNATRIVAELADDPDTLVGLLRKTPAAMAAQLGRIDAQMDKAAAKPVISAAPPPAKKLDSSTVVPEPNLYNEKMSMREWAELRDAQVRARNERLRR